MGIWKPDLTKGWGELFANYHRESSRENSPRGDNTRKVKVVLSLIRYLSPELSWEHQQIAYEEQWQIMHYLHRVCLLPVMFLAHKYLNLLIHSAKYSQGLIKRLYNCMVPGGIYNIFMLRNVYTSLSSYKWQMLPAFFPHLNCALAMSILKCLLSIEIIIPVWNFYETRAHSWPSLHEFWHYLTMTLPNCWLQLIITRRHL